METPTSRVRTVEQMYFELDLVWSLELNIPSQALKLLRGVLNFSHPYVSVGVK